MESRVMPPPQASARQTEMGERFNRVLFAAVDALQEGNIPYALIGGIAASGLGRPRSTHDIDFFVRPEDAEAALEALGRAQFDVERFDPRWLFKGWKDEMMVDIIFKSQGDIYFDDEMQRHAKVISYHGRSIPAVSPEDLIIIKCAVHSEIGPHHWHDALAILSHATLDWNYLLKRARRATRRLLALLIYAQANDIWIPNSIIQELFQFVFGENTQMKSFAHVDSKLPRQQRPAAPTVRTSEPKGRAQQPNVYVLGHIHEALATDARTAHLDCDIVMGTGRILVKGEAQSHEQKRSIEDVLREFAPEFEIDNQVRVFEMCAPVIEVEEVV